MKTRKIKLTSIMLILCMACALILASCGFGDNATAGGDLDSAGISSEAQNETTESDAENSEVTAETETENMPEETEAEPEPLMQTLTISAAGDCTLGVTQEQGYSGSFDSYYDSYGEDYFFDGVRDIFEADDLTVVNLECVLTDATERVEKTYNLKGKPEYVGILTSGSIEACSLGNNHTMDYGQEGFDETKSVLEEAGITYAYSAQSAVYTTKDGIKVGLVSASLLSQSAETVSNMEAQIQELKDNGAAIVIACCHWGIEREYYPSDFQQTTAHALIDAGADLILGCHPHVLQGVEVYGGKVICYSLGNFCFGGNRNPDDKNTVIFQQTFTFSDGELQADNIDASIIPCRLSSADGYNDFQPTVATGDKKSNIIALMNEYSSPFGTAEFDEEGVLIAD
ncbi:MAG: CapA family protein [Clostridiales bacterium]|nr:CapA family protein [Clostridiales bacterium]